MKTIFVDTSFVIALVSDNDKYHFFANQLAEEIENCTFFSTDLVLYQVYEIFSEKYQEKAEEIISTFLEANDVQIVNTAIYEREVLGFKKGNFDMPGNLIDYVSGLVMSNEGIRIIATFNQNFAENGFYVIPGMYFDGDIISVEELTKILK